ncbi:hypothetical protein [Streptomyces sp. ICBB 8177]|uniref:hypothetical protein n=1 Tax=Streptomyces sp. ICBB 8177 TaxID=563922 RepID=UPI000D67D1ED|nr:hypothetical protein [Streptomyces sp. ICBB 8177]PWI42932.1 hypothetical protein CK485_11820 [Streptomyces sp. ICBB 8177]
MVDNAKVGAALVGGYLLGRTKKARMAIGLGMFLAGRKISLDPQAIGRMVSESPLFEGLSAQARKQLVDATKNAATNALTNRVNLLADSLHERTLSLENGENATSEGEADADGETDRAQDEDEEEDGKSAARRSSDQDDGGEQKKSRSRSGSSGTRKTASRASSGARKTASTSSRKASGTARKTASGTTRKTGTTARKTASSARKASSRGGSRG